MSKKEFESKLFALIDQPTDINAFLKTLKDNSIYHVEVSYGPDNPVHRAVLFVGFTETSGYCKVYDNSYDEPSDYSDVHFIQIIKFLADNEGNV